MNRAKRSARADRGKRWVRELTSEPVCVNCGRPGFHFVPPSLGDSGFYICELELAVESRFVRFLGAVDVKEER